jgi:hypothetical protein
MMYCSSALQPYGALPLTGLARPAGTSSTAFIARAVQGPLERRAECSYIVLPETTTSCN